MTMVKVKQRKTTTLRTKNSGDVVDSTVYWEGGGGIGASSRTLDTLLLCKNSRLV